MKLYKAIALLIFISGCKLLSPKSKTDTLWINSTPSTAETTGNLTCYSLQNGDILDTTWTNWCGVIKGFNYEPGFNYQLEVTKVKTPKDSIDYYGTSTYYKLKNTVSKILDIKDEGVYAHINTSLGDIYIRLHYTKSPLTVANFVGLAEGTIANRAKPLGTPYFDSLLFHRVIPGFMIQTGDPQGTGRGGPGYKFKNETHPDLKHNKPGVVAMANSGRNTNGSQFYITHGPRSMLDGGYTIFGEVISGQDVVVAIGNVPRERRDKYKMDRPFENVYMKTVRIIRVGEAADSFNAPAVFKMLK